ncbi:hypothetical protein RCG23_12445 [Neobacillus sp. PS3-34]|uniref:hypothetical protein n=1 Tax=Neobacillus sp. PS3-34 TaxID=3070678 RepID=UPI0027E19CEE|nr:hypothetical protein [Neobacillus sp. PS3-34]WML50440.1 hypothetical protein RCG23_12445 [Neobacillus sp. PS3-34]
MLSKNPLCRSGPDPGAGRRGPVISFAVKAPGITRSLSSKGDGGNRVFRNAV